MNEFAKEIPEVDSIYVEVLRHLLLLHIERNHEFSGNRTEYRTIEDFGLMINFDLQRSFPLLQLKETLTKSIIAELIGFLRGYTHNGEFEALGTKIWSEWAQEDGYLGPIYGAQWRNWNGLGIDQLAEAIDKIKNAPHDRRIMVSAWNVDEIKFMALPPCHYAFQFHCDRDNKLDLLWNQRSCDVFLGLPFNIASYAILLHIIAKLTGREPGRLIGSIGNFHLYENQVKGAHEVLRRFNEIGSGAPTVDISSKVNLDLGYFTSIDNVEPKNIAVYDYNPYPRIKVDVAV